MIHLDIPGWKTIQLEHLVSDFNGTLATDGGLEDGVAEQLERLAKELTIHIVTADTHGTAARVFASLPVHLTKLSAGKEAEAKRRIVEQLGADHTAFLGNGANDTAALEKAVLGVVVIGREGAFAGSLRAADLVTGSSRDALEFFLTPKRLIAGLRR